MQALVYKGPGRVELERWPVPEPGQGEVLIRVKAVSICGSDLGAYRYGSGRFIPPLVLGHEFAGEIAAVGSGVEGWRTGQRVTVNPMLVCRDCYHCNHGMGNLCANRRSIGTSIGGVQTHGAMGEYLTVPAWTLLELEDSISFSAGALLEPAGVCLSCAKLGRMEGEEAAVVVGAGPIGLLVIKFLKAMGTPQVIASDIHPVRLERALGCGADAAVDGRNGDLAGQVRKRTGGLGADRVIIAGDDGNAIPQSFELVRHGGAVTVVAFTHGRVEIDPMEIVSRGLRLLGSYMFTGEMREAAGMLGSGRLAVEDLVTTRLPLSQGGRAFELLCAPDSRDIKIQLVMD